MSNQISLLIAERRTRKASLKALEREISKLEAYKANEDLTHSQKDSVSKADEI